jgi:hypothetical protein
VFREDVAPEGMESSAEYRRLTDRIETFYGRVDALYDLRRLTTDVGLLTRAEYGLTPGDFD